MNLRIKFRTMNGASQRTMTKDRDAGKQKKSTNNYRQEINLLLPKIPFFQTC